VGDPYNNRLRALNKNRLWVLPLATATILLAVSCQPETPPAKPKTLSASEEHGERLYKSSCANCHRSDSADPLNGPGLKEVFKKQYLPSGAPANDDRVHAVIVQGRRTMPGFGQIYDDAQIHDLIAYMRTL
jgi:mono/diheme cytochrome c family protein